MADPVKGSKLSKENRTQKEATDKYLKENNIKILLNRIDKTGRIAIKLNNLDS